MPGLMSGLFDNEESDQTSQTTAIEGNGEIGVVESPSVGVEMGGSYTDSDGSMHQWSNSTQVGTDVDLDVTVATSAQVAEDAIGDAM